MSEIKSREERIRALGVVISHKEPFWQHEEKGLISFVKRKERCPVWVDKSHTRTAHVEKPRNFVADISTKAKGARGLRKDKEWGAQLEYHERQYKITNPEDYIQYYYAKRREDKLPSLCALDLYDASWRGKGRSPLSSSYRHVSIPSAPRKRK